MLHTNEEFVGGFNKLLANFHYQLSKKLELFEDKSHERV